MDSAQVLITVVILSLFVLLLYRSLYRNFNTVLVLSLSVWLLYSYLSQKIPSRLNVHQAPRSKFGLVQVEDFASEIGSNGVDIIFVHGLGSNPDTTWVGRTTDTANLSEKGVNWVTDFLPRDIPSDLRRRLRVFFYNYDSYWKVDAVEERLSSLSNNLLVQLSTRVRQTEKEQNRGLIFVAHSYGGLLVKKALVKASMDEGDHRDILTQTKAIFFLGTPHRGSSFSTLGQLVARALLPLRPNALILEGLEYDSLSLKDLHRDFVAISYKTLHVTNFYETRKTHLVRIKPFQWARYCVQQQSATYEGPNVKDYGLNVNHYGLNKFVVRSDGYDIILAKLLEALNSILSGSLKRFYAVPFQTISSYTDRAALSQDIERKMRKPYKGMNLAHALAIVGLGGSGKTQLALNFAEKHKDMYNPILWIDGKSKETIRSSFERCARELHIPFESITFYSPTLIDLPAVQALLRWLRNRDESESEWLVVIDNADDLTQNVGDVIPTGNRGSVIVTSQDNKIPDLFRTRLRSRCEETLVSKLEPHEADTLLLQRFEKTPAQVPPNVRDMCVKISELLGYLALAVDLAGAYVKDKYDHSLDSNSEERLAAAFHRSLTDYQRHLDELLKDDSYRGLSSYEKSMKTVWDTTLYAIDKQHEWATLLLTFLAHMNHANIQDELFRLASESTMFRREGPAWLKKVLQTTNDNRWDDFHYQTALQCLIRFSLLQTVRGEWPGVSMHALVQRQARQRGPNAPWAGLPLLFMGFICHQLVSVENVENYQFRRHLVVHLPDISALSAYGMPLDAYSPMLLSWLAQIFDEEGRWKEAEELQMQVVGIVKRARGADDPETLLSIGRLAKIYRHQGRWKEAEDLQTQVLEVNKRVLGNECLETLANMNDLASTYTDLGRYNEAENLQVQAVEIAKKVLGEKDQLTLDTINNLAVTYMKLGRLEEAGELYVKVIEASKRLLGYTHPTTLNSMSNLVVIHRRQGELGKAKELSMQVIEMRKRVLGNDHPATLRSMDTLVTIYMNLGKWDEAWELAIHVLKTKREVLGVYHPDTLYSMNHVVALYGVHGKLDEATELGELAVELHRRVLGDEHPNTLATINTLAPIYRALGLHEKAAQLL